MNKTLRTLTALIATVALLTLNGCTSTNLEADTFKLKRTSFLQRIDIPEASIGTNGTVSIKGYKTDGGNEALVNALVTLSQAMALMKTAAVPAP